LGCSSRPTFVQAFFSIMIESNVPFDLAGLSFYPSYTGTERPTTETLQSCILEIANLGKKTLICEYAYPSSPSPEDPTLDGPVAGFPLTPQGQANYVAYFLRWCNSNPNVVGAIYFYPDNCLSETEPKIHPGPHLSLVFNETTAKPALKEFDNFKSSLFPSPNPTTPTITTTPSPSLSSTPTQTETPTQAPQPTPISSASASQSPTASASPTKASTPIQSPTATIYSSQNPSPSPAIPEIHFVGILFVTFAIVSVFTLIWRKKWINTS